MYSLVTYTVQLNPSLLVYFISDKIVLKCVKTHDSRILFPIPFSILRTVNTLDLSSHPVNPLSTVIFPVSVLSKFYTSTSVFLFTNINISWTLSTDLLKPVTDIMSVTLLSRVFSVQSRQCHMLSWATVTGFVGTVTGFLS